jgi:hypothetical protein
MKPFDSTKPVIHTEIAPLRLTYSSITTVAYLPSPNYGHGRLHGRPAVGDHPPRTHKWVRDLSWNLPQAVLVNPRS